MKNHVYLAYESCEGRENLVGVYSDIGKAVDALKPLVKSHYEYLSESQAKAARKWKHSAGNTIIECNFISDDMSMSFYAVEAEVL